MKSNDRRTRLNLDAISRRAMAKQKTLVISQEERTPDPLLMSPPISTAEHRSTGPTVAGMSTTVPGDRVDLKRIYNRAAANTRALPAVDVERDPVSEGGSGIDKVSQEIEDNDGQKKASQPEAEPPSYAYRFRIPGGGGGGVCLSAAATVEEVKAELLKRWPVVEGISKLGGKR